MLLYQAKRTWWIVAVSHRGDRGTDGFAAGTTVTQALLEPAALGVVERDAEAVRGRSAAR
ncbi:hypothetical protein GCM10025868_24470 [Angustibacter aerolatus]|uniref:Uncharacterized protein n=1 Tax=Angustibacter aerolatus TaxID=1162965 RepID=A0ABQ6JJZ8_9ACTN|nr:hypothetical protein GCM10025868_24470 [Angustibacter aerolatus]